jgi:hypothetical protein
MKMIGNFPPYYPTPDFVRRYKNYDKAKKAMEKHWVDTGFEAFIVRGDKRDSHDKKQTSQETLTYQTLL